MNKKGAGLVITIMFLFLMTALLGAYHIMSKIDIQNLRSANNYEKSFFVAEAALNTRAEEFRNKFQFYTIPTGTSPSEENGQKPCTGENLGSGDFVCDEITFSNQKATTYVMKKFEDDPDFITIPNGEPFSGLVAYEYQYDVLSSAENPNEEIGAILGLRFKSRVVPIFQFAAFYDKDIEITNTEDMLIDGPVHANGNAYLRPGNSTNLVINGQLTLSGDIWRGRKAANDCYNDGNIYVINSSPIDFNNYNNFLSEVTSDDFTSFGISSNYNCNSSNRRRNLDQQTFSEWNNQIMQNVSEVELPNIASTYPGQGNEFWDLADIRIVLNLNGSDNIDRTNAVTGVEVRANNNSLISSHTTAINNCFGQADGDGSGSVDNRAVNAHTNTFWDQLRQADIKMLEIDLENLIECLHTNSIVSKNDATNGGIIIYLTVEGNNSYCNYSNESYNCFNNYGIRIRNADNLIGITPKLNGINLVTDQPIYLMGNYNIANGSGEKIPSSIYADALTVLSSAWNDSYDSNTQSSQGSSPSNWTNYMLSRNASNTTINSALVAGTITTGDSDGESGHDTAPNSAGLNNYTRLLEDWSDNNANLTIVGSFISLSKTRRARALSSSGSNAGIQTGYHYTVPGRKFIYDRSFNDPDNFPPAAISFVYLKQIFFTREFEQ